MSSEHGQTHLYDLDPPASLTSRVARGVVGCAVLVLTIFLIWFLMAPDQTTGASSAEPVVDSISRIFRGVADVALPLWSRLCNVVQN